MLLAPVLPIQNEAALRVTFLGPFRHLFPPQWAPVALETILLSSRKPMPPVVLNPLPVTHKATVATFQLELIAVRMVQQKCCRPLLLTIRSPIANSTPPTMPLLGFLAPSRCFKAPILTLDIRGTGLSACGQHLKPSRHMDAMS